jgi:hypothetical protein
MTVLVSELVHKYYGKPILVIGGGLSAIVDIDKLDRTPACVLSANQHGFMLPIEQNIFPPDYAICVDHKRGQTDELMQDYLRGFGKPIIGQCYWCDYRLADWPLSGNSGLTAIAVAVLMGGHPVIAVGMDGMTGGYFHDNDHGPTNWSRDQFMKQARELEIAARGAWIVAMSGPLCDVFDEEQPEFQITPDFVSRAAELKSIKARARADFYWLNAHVRAGTELVLSEKEMAWAKRHGYAVEV